jgi:hypothetical protein
VGILGQHNGTGTYLGEERVNSGTVEFEVKFDVGYLAPKGGGKHFLEIMSWMADRGDRKAIRAQPSSRIELANLGDRPRCLVWNYGPQFRGQATTIFSIGPAFEPDRWYQIRFDWSYREPTGRVTIHVDARSYTAAFEFVRKTVGPGRYFLFGHVETTQPEGRLRFRNFRVRNRAPIQLKQSDLDPVFRPPPQYANDFRGFPSPASNNVSRKTTPPEALYREAA